MLFEEPRYRKTITLERQTVTVGAAAAVVFFLLGLAFSLGGKSSSLDKLTLEVQNMHSSIDQLSAKVAESDKSNAVDIGQLKFEYQDLSKKVDQIVSRMEYDEAGGKR